MSAPRFALPDMTRNLLLVLLVTALAVGLWTGRGLFGAPAIATGDAAVAHDPSSRAEPATSRGSGLDPPSVSREARIDVERDVAEAAAAVQPARATRGALIVHARLEGGGSLGDLPVLVKPAGSLRPMSDTRRVRTDAEGRARVDDLPPGEVSIWSTHGGRASAEVLAGAEVEAELVLKGVVDVTGRVFDADGAPVPDARVWLVNWRRDWLGTSQVARCDADGRFSVRHVSTYDSLGATAPGRGPSVLVDLEQVDTSESPVELELALGAEGGDLRGRVTSSASGPLQGALVAVGAAADYDMRYDGSRAESWSAWTAVTDAEGRYRLEGLPAGTQPVHAFAEGHALLESEVALVAGAATVLDLALERGAAATGVVRDEAGEPVADALVLALPEPFDDPFPTQGPTDRGAPFHIPATRSGPDGRYRLPDLPLGTVHLHASKGTSYWDDGDYQGTVQRTFTSVTADGIAWDPVLSRGRRIHGLVTYADGAPLGSVFVSATEADTARRLTVHAGTDGRFSIPALENRAYTVSVQLWDAPDDAAPLRREDVWPSEDELLLVASYSKVVEAQATLRARIVDSAGRVEGKGRLVFAHDNGWRHAGERDGVWTCQVPPGRYQARVLFGDRIVGHGPWVDVAPGEVRDLGAVHTLPACDLTVRVRRPPGYREHKLHATVRGATEQRLGGKEIPADTNELVFADQLEGPVTVTLSGPGVAIEARELTLVAGAANEVLFDVVGAAGCGVLIECPAERRAGFGVLTVTYRRADGSEYSRSTWYEKWGGALPLETRAYFPLGSFTLEATTTSGLRATGAVTIESLADAPSVTLRLAPE